MSRGMIEVPLMQLAVEHYLFDLGYPVEKVSEILDVNQNTVKEIYENYIRLTTITK